MPLLAPEPFVYPDELLQQSLPAGEACWWVLHTRPRAEKALARRMLALSVPFFLPQYPRRWRNGSRLFTSQVPLFPGYFFVFGDAEARLFALRTNLVAQSVPVGDQRRLHDDLVRVHRLMGAGLPLTPEERLQPGDAVEIVAGPLAGLGGKVLRRGKRLTFFIEVELLRQGVSVELETWMVQPRGDHPADSLPGERGR